MNGDEIEKAIKALFNIPDKNKDITKRLIAKNLKIIWQNLCNKPSNAPTLSKRMIYWFISPVWGHRKNISVIVFNREKKTNKFVKFTENYVIKSQSNLAVKVLEVVRETQFFV